MTKYGVRRSKLEENNSGLASCCSLRLTSMSLNPPTFQNETDNGAIIEVLLSWYGNGSMRPNMEWRQRLADIGRRNLTHVIVGMSSAWEGVDGCSERDHRWPREGGGGSVPGTGAGEEACAGGSNHGVRWPLIEGFTARVIHQTDDKIDMKDVGGQTE